MEELCKKVVEALKKRDFEAAFCATKEEAAAAVLAETARVARVGMGGAMTMKELGVAEKLEQEGKLLTRGADCDVFLLSANAVTADGRIVNIDGNGNRVAAMTFGPETVIVIASLNKVMPDLDSAMMRARGTAAPVNMSRFDLKTPCKMNGLCADCASPDRICNYFQVIARCKPAGKIKLILVGEPLGF